MAFRWHSQVVRQRPAKPPSLGSNPSATFDCAQHMLFLVATPIGHLDDFSKRAIDSLNASDLILCEDTRRSRHLLERYDINKPLLSYHKFKEKQALKNIVDQLQNGHVISLISDAGTPCINDPGYLLVTACIERQIPFTHIPGACSIIQALLLSGCDP